MDSDRASRSAAIRDRGVTGVRLTEFLGLFLKENFKTLCFCIPSNPQCERRFLQRVIFAG
jgi:hypothetical protein